MQTRGDRSQVLSIHRAFVVEFSASTRVETGHLAGRVEHVVSHQALHFESLETLLAFVARVLKEGSDRSLTEES